MAALRTNVQIALDFRAIQHRIAGRTLDPQTFRHRPRSALGLDPRWDDAFKPGHASF
jgi:hypothetical protein